MNLQPGHDLKRNRGNENPHTLTEDAAEREEHRGKLLGRAPKTTTHVIIRTVDLILVIEGTKYLATRKRARIEPIAHCRYVKSPFSANKVPGTPIKSPR